MEYRIYVAKLKTYKDITRYVYVFDTRQVGIHCTKCAYDEIKAKFPEPEYKVTFEIWEHAIKEVDADEYFAKLYQ